MGALIFLIAFFVIVAVGTPLFMAFDWYCSYRLKGETFKEYCRKF